MCQSPGCTSDHVAMPVAAPSLGRRGILRLMLGTTAAATVAGCAGGGVNLISAEQVTRAGLGDWQKLRQERPPSRNGGYQQAVQRVGGRIVQAAGHDPRGWEMVVFRGEEANAFTLPGAKIGVFEGLFEHVQDDTQLATILGHEVGHNLANHATQRVNTQAGTQIGVALLGAALGAYAGVDPSSAAQLLGAGAQLGLLLPYGRRQELEADRIGLELMARAGYDPRGAIVTWQNLANARRRPPEFLSTHPAPGNRIAQLEQLMPQAMAMYQRRG